MISRVWSRSDRVSEWRIHRKESVMTRKRTNRPAANSSPTVLSKLRRIYNHQPPRQYDKFGRRAALPSEIAAYLKQQKPVADA